MASLRGRVLTEVRLRAVVEREQMQLVSSRPKSRCSPVHRSGPDDKPTAPQPHLTPRQVEVLRLLEQGRSTKQIAAELQTPSAGGRDDDVRVCAAPRRARLLTAPASRPTSETAEQMQLVKALCRFVEP
jgi:FixJ family two-component response regulator